MADISAQDIKNFEGDFNSDPKNQVAVNVFTRFEQREALVNYARDRDNLDDVYSVQIADEGKPVTNQKSSGRCWLFACLNVMRIPFIKENKLDSFEFSQNFFFFWDKFERCNYFLENIIETMNEPLDGRLVQYMLSKPTEDGGQFDMIVNIVEKYGLVPQKCYPDTQNCEASRRLNQIINLKLRDDACQLRKAFVKLAEQFKVNTSEGNTDYQKNDNLMNELRNIKKAQLNTIYRLMVTHLGPPPATVNWRAKNKDKKIIHIKDITPLQFYNEYCRKFVDMANMVSLIHDPRNEYYKTYTVSRLGNIVGGKRPNVIYVNLPVDKLKEYAVNCLKAGEPVWFGCDVGAFHSRKRSIMDMQQFDFKLMLNVDFSMTKAERLQYGESLMTHAMVFTGVDIDESGDNKIKKWRVENSWGDKSGDKGYCTMTDEWFNEFNYQVALDQNKYLPNDVKDVLKLKPIVLPPWDPMGALAKNQW